MADNHEFSTWTSRPWWIYTYGNLFFFLCLEKPTHHLYYFVMVQFNLINFPLFHATFSYVPHQPTGAGNYHDKYSKMNPGSLYYFSRCKPPHPLKTSLGVVSAVGITVPARQHRGRHLLLKGMRKQEKTWELITKIRNWTWKWRIKEKRKERKSRNKCVRELTTWT